MGLLFVFLLKHDLFVTRPLAFMPMHGIICDQATLVLFFIHSNIVFM